MAINKNHEFEELNGIKCAIVEKNASPSRVEFLKSVLIYNGYTVIVISTPPAKQTPATAESEAPVIVPEETFTVGVTDVTFSPVNAIFGRLLKAPNGRVVTLAYWNQKEKEPHDEIPYYEFKA